MKTSKSEEIFDFKNVKRKNNKIITDENQLKVHKESIIYRIINEIRKLINI